MMLQYYFQKQIYSSIFNLRTQFSEQGYIYHVIDQHHFELQYTCAGSSYQKCPAFHISGTIKLDIECVT